MAALNKIKAIEARCSTCKFVDGQNLALGFIDNCLRCIGSRCDNYGDRNSKKCAGCISSSVCYLTRWVDNYKASE